MGLPGARGRRGACRRRLGHPVLGLVAGIGCELPAVDRSELAVLPPRAPERHAERLAAGCFGIGLAHDGVVIYARRA